MNELPIDVVDLAAIAAVTPCLCTWLAINIHISEAHARAALRPIASGQSRGTTSSESMRKHLSYAIRQRNVMPMRVDHLHAVFTRLKSNGKEVRMIVDGSDGDHPNAFNSRLPRPPAPPGLLRVPTVVAMVMSGDEFGTDDVRTAFATMSMCRTMSKALGVGLPPTRHRPALVAAHVRVPQGGTWSAAACQGHALTAAIPPPAWPPTALRPNDLPTREQMSAVAPANWFPVLCDVGTIVHIDDVISFGPVGTVDERRHAMRTRSERLYNMRWKESRPAQRQGNALGMFFDVSERRVWGVQESWIAGIQHELDDWNHAQEDDIVWARGCTAWVTQVLHAPAIVNALVDRSWPGRILALGRARVSYVEELTLRDRLTAWPRARPSYAQLSDACGTGWAGAWLGGDIGVAGRWYRCGEDAVLSHTPCCSTESIRIASGEMVIGEAMATIATYAAGMHTSRQDHLILTDNAPWAGALASATSPEHNLAALIVFMWMIADGQIATAHVRGEENTLDGPSRGTALPLLTELPPHTAPRWSTIGAVRRCRHTADALWQPVRRALPCAWRALGDAELSRPARSACACPQEHAPT